MSLVISDILELSGHRADPSVENYFVNNGGGWIQVDLDDIYDDDHYLRVCFEDEGHYLTIDVHALLSLRFRFRCIPQEQHIR